MTNLTLKQLDGMGRPVLRLAGITLLLLVGSAIALKFWLWAIFNTPMAELPGQAILLALIPQVPQIVDQITRSVERVRQISTGREPYAVVQPNPHGGPGAP